MEYQVGTGITSLALRRQHREQHVHNLDVANWVKGDHPVEANGMGGRLLRKAR